jgi:hypothetical protein
MWRTSLGRDDSWIGGWRRLERDFGISEVQWLDEVYDAWLYDGVDTQRPLEDKKGSAFCIAWDSLNR